MTNKLKSFSIIPFIVIFVISFCLFFSPVHATSGACSAHNGVNCSRGRQPDGTVYCNDNWTESIVSYDFTKMCQDNQTDFIWSQYNNDGKLVKAVRVVDQFTYKTSEYCPQNSHKKFALNPPKDPYDTFFYCVCDDGYFAKLTSMKIWALYEGDSCTTEAPYAWTGIMLDARLDTIVDKTKGIKVDDKYCNSKYTNSYAINGYKTKEKFCECKNGYHFRKDVFSKNISCSENNDTKINIGVDKIENTNTAIDSETIKMNNVLNDADDLSYKIEKVSDKYDEKTVPTSQVATKKISAPNETEVKIEDVSTIVLSTNLTLSSSLKRVLDIPGELINNKILAISDPATAFTFNKPETVYCRAQSFYGADFIAKAGTNVEILFKIVNPTGTFYRVKLDSIPNKNGPNNYFTYSPEEIETCFDVTEKTSKWNLVPKLEFWMLENAVPKEKRGFFADYELYGKNSVGKESFYVSNKDLVTGGMRKCPDSQCPSQWIGGTSDCLHGIKNSCGIATIIEKKDNWYKVVVSNIDTTHFDVYGGVGWLSENDVPEVNAKFFNDEKQNEINSSSIDQQKPDIIYPTYGQVIINYIFGSIKTFFRSIFRIK